MSDYSLTKWDGSVEPSLAGHGNFEGFGWDEFKLGLNRYIEKRWPGETLANGSPVLSADERYKRRKDRQKNKNAEQKAARAAKRVGGAA